MEQDPMDLAHHNPPFFCLSGVCGKVKSKNDQRNEKYRNKGK